MRQGYLLFVWIWALLTDSVNGLIKKDFEKFRIKYNEDIDETELETIQGMDWQHCSYLCMKDTANCNKFYVSKDGSCLKVNEEVFEKGKKGDEDTRILYTEEKVEILGKYLLINISKYSQVSKK